MKTNHSLSRNRLLPTAYCLLILLLMQVTTVNKAYAQIISGPDNVQSGTYSVPGLSPYIQYNWTLTGHTSYTLQPNLPVAPGAVNESIAVTWDLCAPSHKLEVIEVPVFGNNIIYLNAVGNNLAPPYHISDDGQIENAILTVKSLGGGTVHLNGGDPYFVTSILLAEGVRLEGDGVLQTILQRPDFVKDNPAYNNVKMLNTYEAPYDRLYSFVPINTLNSKPIEIRDLTLDGRKTMPEYVPNPLFGQQGQPATILNPNVNDFQNSALIFLDAPYIIPIPPALPASVTINNIVYPNGYNAQNLGASGKLKVFINHCNLKNSGGDAVLQGINVDLTMTECNSWDIYRGTHTVIAGDDKARLKKIISYPASPNTSTKSIDYETQAGEFGYNNSKSFRIWIDQCDFDRKAEFDYFSSQLLITNTKLQNAYTVFIGILGGDLVANNCEFRFHAGVDGASHQLLSPTHAKFKSTKFFIESAPNNPFTTYNGIRFTYQAGPPYFGAHLGFDGCEFHNVTSPLLTPAYGLFLPDNANLPSTVEFYFNNCITSNCTILPNNYNGLLFMYDDAVPANPVASPNAVAPGVVNMNQIYTGGESEDEMKTHFGIRPIYLLNFCTWNIVNITCNNVNNGSISATAVGVPGTINYTLLPNNITNLTGNFTNLAAGIYTITATDASNLAITSGVFTITQPPALIVSISNITNVSCNGGCDGTAQASGAGGTPAYTYSITAPGIINANTGAITNLCAGTYTVTNTDAYSCTATTSFTITQPPVLLVSTSNITDVSCNGGCDGTAQASGAGGTPGYTYSITAPGIINANTGAITNICAGAYTVTTTDANLCTATTTFTITQPAVLSAAVSNISNVTCNQLCNGSAQASGSGGIVPYTYAITAPGNINANTGALTGLCAGSYTVTVTDANGCTATTTLSVTQPPALIWTATNFTNISCSSPLANDGSITVAASGGVGAITYILNYPGGPLVNPLGIFDPLVAHSYTVTASDASGCTISTIIELVAPNTGNFCCNTTLVNTGNVILAKAPTAGNLLALYGNGTNTISNKTFYIDDILIIDEDITFNACTLWFTQSGQIQLQVPYTLDVNTSTLQAACDWWEGIVANDPQQKVIIENGSFIKQAVSGVYASNGALIEVSNSHFVDNIHYGIQLENIAGNYLGFIKGNTFSHPNAAPASFLPPYRKIGVGMTNISEMTIGELGTNSISNTFSNLNTGIYIKYAQPTGSNTINIYNCAFSDISHIGLSDYQKLTGCYSSQIGAAIYCNAGGTQSLVSNLDIRNDAGIMANSYLNCDKGIVAHGSGVSAKNLKMENCLFGIMCNSTSSRHYVMTDNIIDHTYMGIELTGQQRSASIQGNTIGCTKTIFRPSELVNGMYTMPIFYVPLGIKYQLNGMAPLQYYAHTISANHIYINRIGGIGVYNGNADNRLIEEDNEVHFTTTNMVAADNYSVRSLIGYWNENTFGSNFNRNDAFGSSNPAVWQARNSWGMYMNQSKNCKISCNRLKFTRYGFYTWGNCSTAPENITLNKCNANEFPWFFLDNGSASPGTFGDVGGIADNGNEFLSTTNLVDWRGLAGINNGLFKVYRNSGATGFSNFISTTDNLLDWFETGPSGVEYQFQFNNSGYNDICVDNDPDPVYINGEPTIDSSEYIHGMAVVQDSVEYLNYPTVGSWIDKYRLYLELDEDSLLRNSSPELLYFYNTTTSQTIGDIRFAIEKIALLYDSTTNAANDSLRYANAMAANSLISSANQWEMNEKLVNDVLLFMWHHSLDSLPLQTKEEIQSLASSCPFVEGTAVYRARTLHSYWEPNAVFDDRLLCIQGQNKNQDNSIIDIDSLIEGQIRTQNVPITQNNTQSNTHAKLHTVGNTIKLYPNPATNIITVEYTESIDGELQITNNIGQVILQTELGADNTKVQIPLQSVAVGLYYYKIQFGEKVVIGKLNIIE